MNDPRIQELQEMVKSGDVKSDFADSLITQYNKKGALSDKQWYWCQKLVEDGLKRPETVELGNTLKPLVELLLTAKQKLKYPKIHIKTNDGHPVCLALAGAKSKYSGSIMVTDGAPFSNNKYYGRISPEGVWTKPFKEFEEMDEITRLLEGFSNDPVAAATKYGHMHGACCFCNSTLTDPKSTSVGYGPQCASNWGLPWGVKKA